MKKILLVFFFFSFFLANYNFAVASNVCDFCDSSKPCVGTDLECTDGQCQEKGKTTFCSFSQNKKIEDLIDKVSSWMLVIALVVAPLMILLGAFYILTAAGDKSRFAKGRAIIVWALIGLAIFLFAKAFISILKSFLW